MFEYRLIPGADPAQPRATGLPFPAFGFPSRDAACGAVRQTEKGAVQVPGLGDPNAPESNSLCVVDVSDPAAAKVVTLHSHRRSFRRQRAMAAAVPRAWWPPPTGYLFPTPATTALP